MVHRDASPPSSVIDSEVLASTLKLFNVITRLQRAARPSGTGLFAQRDSVFCRFRRTLAFTTFSWKLK
ncbi:hypothetical protein JYU34_008703 [Plutella xylostella]|uniref:Uncharacterized protein n=1 Tax=Plutella xylostella TaxID=51655 RepID=A0ABQ7QMP2_PLUXY|nr:hypothetical protein JYU34_008703 [Plutella xylostella]